MPRPLVPAGGFVLSERPAGAPARGLGAVGAVPGPAGRQKRLQEATRDSRSSWQAW